MAFDELLAERVRAALVRRAVENVREVRMFGGLAFMVADRMVVCVSGGGGDLLVRVSPERGEALVAMTGAEQGVMGRGRSMGTGWIAVGAAALAAEDSLAFWLDEALAFHAAG